MNFYKHHLGDYDGATAHLTWDEDMAYTRLLRTYYRREAPIPAAEAYRLVRASSKAQREAVDSVLGEFFSKGEGGWRNKRADEEIAEYHESEEGRATKRENEKDRQRLHRARRKDLFEALRRHDRIPSWDTTTDELETMLNTCQSLASHTLVTRDASAPVTRDATANQNQNQNQIPEPEKKGKAARKRATPFPEAFQISEQVKTWAKQKGYSGLEAYLEFFAGRMKANGKTYVGWDEAFMNCIREDWPGFRKQSALPDYSGVAERIKD
jgi:uncharacterized protein YdaU (DUF1376 family)